MNIEIEKKYRLNTDEVEKVKSQIESVFPCEWGVFDTLDIRYGIVENQFGSADFHRLRFQKTSDRLRIYLAKKYSDASGVRRDEEVEIDFDQAKKNFLPGKARVIHKIRSTTTLQTKDGDIPEIKVDIDELPSAHKAFLELEVMTDDLSAQEAIFARFALVLAKCGLVLPETDEMMIMLSDEVEIDALQAFLDLHGFANM